MLHNVSIIHAPCIFQLKNHGARNGNVGPVARVNFTRGVFSNGVEEKSPALLPFCPAAKVEKKLEQIFSPARNVFTIYDIRIKLISEIKSWYRNFFRLFSCFRKSNKWRGGSPRRRNSDKFHRETNKKLDEIWMGARAMRDKSSRDKNRATCTTTSRSSSRHPNLVNFTFFQTTFRIFAV